jgi:purine nucleosidase/pyrimidine-specific ribonucleoside hydrolase
MTKMLIDTDPGQDIDDLLAIWFALRRPELDVRAITTVTWPADQRVRLVNRLLRYLDRTDIPVAAGVQFPLRPFSEDERTRQFDPKHSMNHACFAEPHNPRDACTDFDAVSLIINTVRAHPNEITLACIAPLTNIATALTRDPGIAPLIRAIWLMGGELTLNRREHNIAFDYIASQIVLASGVPISMGTWDVTRRFVLNDDDCARIGRQGELGAALLHAIKVWHPCHAWKPGPVMYDVFPFAHAVDRSLYTLRETNVQVETSGQFTRGMTIEDSSGARIQVTTDINASAVRQLYLDTLCTN